MIAIILTECSIREYQSQPRVLNGLSVIPAVSDSSLLEIPATESPNSPVDSPNPLVLLPSAIPVPTVHRSVRGHRKPQRLIEELT